MTPLLFEKTVEKGISVRTKALKFWIVGLLVVGFCGLAARASGLETFHALPPATQYAAPAFTLPDQHGTPMRLDDLRGKVVVVRFWVTW
jgi:cytochrome oxidase Cu insertion factor (SCO1/SenC/PrrC family)